MKRARSVGLSCAVHAALVLVVVAASFATQSLPTVKGEFVLVSLGPEKPVLNIESPLKTRHRAWQDAWLSKRNVPEQGSPAAPVSPLSIVGESFNQNAVRAAIQRIFGDFRNCYEKTLLTDRGVGGLVGFTFHVLASGEVKEVPLDLALSATPESKQILAACLAVKAMGAKFPGAATEYIVQYELRLSAL